VLAGLIVTSGQARGGVRAGLIRAPLLRRSSPPTPRRATGRGCFHSGNEVELSKSAYPVQPGDSMTASVSVKGGAWTLTISNGTESWSSVTRASWSTPAQSSAEWIAERPTIGMSLPSLANFATVAFTGAGATDAGTSGPISDFTIAPIEMLASPSDVLASPSQLDQAGTDFTDTWDSSS
jgi:hypothetical protein